MQVIFKNVLPFDLILIIKKIIRNHYRWWKNLKRHVKIIYEPVWHSSAFYFRNQPLVFCYGTDALYHSWMVNENFILHTYFIEDVHRHVNCYYDFKSGEYEVIDDDDPRISFITKQIEY